MAKTVQWKGWDDTKLADLSRVVDSLRSARFSLELLRGAWDRMDDNEIDPMIDTLRDMNADLAEIFRDFEEQRDSEDE